MRALALRHTADFTERRQMSGVSAEALRERFHKPVLLGLAE